MIPADAHPDEPSSSALAAAPVLPVLYEDDVMCAVMKPEKLLVHRTEIANGDAVFAVQCVREQLGRRVWPVHRLDRGTSGVLLFALDAQTASRLGRIMMAGEVRKRYAALVRGWLPEAVDCRHPLSLPRIRISRSAADRRRHRTPARSSFREPAPKRPCRAADSRPLVSGFSRPNSSREGAIRYGGTSNGSRTRSSETPRTGRDRSTGRSPGGSASSA